MTKAQNYKFKKPQLLRGLLSIIVLITSMILLASWLIINYQVEKLVAQRTSEYARSITQIAANSAAEALLSDDKLQLQMLVSNVANDPYIRSATIFADDGQIVAEKKPEVNIKQEPSNPAPAITDKVSTENVALTKKESVELEEIENLAETETTSIDPALIKAKTQAYIESQEDIPFIEKIVYQGVTAGWFKITLNRKLLELKFRESLANAQKVILAIGLTLFIFLFFIARKYKRRVMQLVNYNHRLIKLNAESLPRNQQQWMNSLAEISETQFQDLPEHSLAPAEETLWQESHRQDEVMFCYCQFSMDDQDHELTAPTLTLAETYLQSALQSFGVQSQGDILSGCLVPLLDHTNKQEALNEALSLIFLIEALISTLQLPLRMRAFVGCGTILTLLNERGVITGVSLSNRMMDKLNKLAPHTQFGETHTLGIEEESLGQVVEVNAVDDQDFLLNSLCFKVVGASEAIKQRINRQVHYIIAQQNKESDILSQD